MLRLSKKDLTNPPKRRRKEHPPPKNTFKRRFLRAMLLGAIKWYPRIWRLLEYIVDMFS